LSDQPAPRLEAQDLSRRYGALRALDGVGLRVAPGECLCLIGPSGCGKTTLLRLIAGVERPEAGTIRIDGREVAGPGRFVPPEARGIGLMFQDLALFPHLDLAANVGFGLTGGGRAARAARVAELLARTGLAGRERARPETLSGGQQARAALARALAPRPGVMLLDEPFAALDPRLRERLAEETLVILRAEGTAVVMVTHDPAEALRLADRVLMLRAGRAVQAGRPADLHDRPVDRDAAAFLSPVNVVPARIAGGRALSVLGTLPAPHLPEGSRAEIVIRPYHAGLAAAGEGVPARLVSALRTGRDVELRLVLEPGDVPFRLWIAEGPGRDGAALPGPGARVGLRICADLCHVFPA